MRTEDLIEALARDTRPVAARRVEQVTALALIVGFGVSLAATLIWLGPRPDMARAVHTGGFWLKMAYPLAVVIAAMSLGCALVRPACPTRARARWASAPFLIIFALGAVSFALAPGADRATIWWGHSWDLCPWYVLLFSLPPFVGVSLAFRQFAPTRLRLAGFVAGLSAGGVGAFAYAFSCNETGIPFLAAWFTLGILLAGGLGALLGPRILRW